ncbi:MAG TPA: hypothetical protein VFD58_28275 [Blastocatellia bacterium]|nr:hypothetical protein [Blastocatellia bacterium]
MSFEISASNPPDQDLRSLAQGIIERTGLGWKILWTGFSHLRGRADLKRFCQLCLEIAPGTRIRVIVPEPDLKSDREIAWARAIEARILDNAARYRV